MGIFQRRDVPSARVRDVAPSSIPGNDVIIQRTDIVQKKSGPIVRQQLSHKSMKIISDKLNVILKHFLYLRGRKKISRKSYVTLLEKAKKKLRPVPVREENKCNFRFVIRIANGSRRRPSRAEASAAPEEFAGAAARARQSCQVRRKPASFSTRARPN